MREVFFNSFKEKMLNGQVPVSFECSGIPVNSTFFDNYDNTEIALEQYRNLEDFNTYSENVQGIKPLKNCLFEYSSFGVEYSAYEPDDLSDKPIFVNPDNWEKFLHVYYSDVSATSGTLATYLWNTDSGDIQATEDLENTNSGFYYVTKKSHLNWIAKRTNDENNFNNKLKVVLGDDIGNWNDTDTLESMICTNPERPFQGVFDMNCHKLINKKFICKNNSNGLIGYLGPRGVVRNGIVENILFSNQQKISLEKMVHDCSDVVVGALVGTNYGTVENIITSGEMRFDGFCPEVYTVGNKYEYTQGDSTNTNSAYNGFFPNKFCINSIYNIIPYVGYFNEGVDSLFDDVGSSRFTNCQLDIYNLEDLPSLVLAHCNEAMGYSLLGGLLQMHRQGLKMYSEPKCSVSDVLDQSSVRMTKSIPSADGWYGGDGYLQYMGNVSVNSPVNVVRGFRSPLITTEFTQLFLDRVLCNTIDNLGSWKTYDEKGTYSIAKLLGSDDNHMMNKDFDHGSYIAQQILDTVVMFIKRGNEKVTPHQRMNPGARIAYYCSPIVGNNFGTIRFIDCRHHIKESSDTFVGFIGGVCGKQNCGEINGVTTVLDIVENDMNSSADSGCQNMYRNYTRDYQHTPEYGDDYHNLVNVFGYNYDYYQNANGFSDLSRDMKVYSGCSADCVRVSPRFYDFKSFICSGVNGNCYFDDDKNRFGTHWTFNSYDNDYSDSAFENCNFRVNDSATRSSIGSDIPIEIKNAKLTFGPPSADLSNAPYTEEERAEAEQSLIDDGGTNLFRMTYKISRPELDGVECPNQGEIKVFNNWNDKWKSNVAVPLWSIANDASAAVLEDLSTISFRVKHLDLNYLGDAAKTLDERDNPGGLNDISLADALEYGEVFNNSAHGSTRQNAIGFARNIMNAKVALGCDMLSNSAFDPNVIYPGYESPFNQENGGPFGTCNRSESWLPSDYNSKFVIPSATGPNETNAPKNLFSSPSNGPDFCWYMPPGTYAAGEDGPAAKNPVSNDSFGFLTTDIINDHANNPNMFCSIREDMMWDAVMQTDNNRLTQDQFGVKRSLIEVTPLRAAPSDLDLDDKAESIVAGILGSTKTLESMVTEEEAQQMEGMSGEEKLNLILGEQWSARIEKIRIPLAGRTQNGATKVGFFQNTDVSKSGIYYTERDGDPCYLVTKNEDGTGKINHIAHNNTATGDGKRAVGNLDDMFVDITIFGPQEEDKSHKMIHVLLRVPISRIYLPISAVEETSMENDLNVETFTHDLANQFSGVEGMKYNKRHVKFWPLIPAYDVNETNGTQIGFQLKSIYNIGAVAGMINHSERFIEYGNFESGLRSDGTQKPESEATGTFNKAECGSIMNVRASMTKSAADFINRLTNASPDYYGSEDANDRVIGIASKFALVAPVYEYHQNEIGTSPFPGFEREDCNTNGLMLLQQDAQVTRFRNIELWDGFEAEFDKVNSRIFKPFIEWANISNVLDYNNFFMKRSGITQSDSQYVPFQSSNYPEAINIMHNVTSLADKAWDDLKMFGLTRNWLDRRHWPIWNETTPMSPMNPTQVEGDQKYTISTDELYSFGSVAGENSIRNNMNKSYHLFPTHLIRVDGLKLVKSTGAVSVGQIDLHMSPTCDSPNSDYYDIYQQLLDGSPNFAFTKLYKSIISSPINLHQDVQVSNMPTDFNTWMLYFYMRRIEDGIHDRYFTWDYDMGPTDNHELSFHVMYANVREKETRGLWIHQIDKQSDGIEFLKYAMKGADECMNDGGCVRLGYMPSEWALIQLMNRRDDNSKPGAWFDEGIAVKGDDYRGMLLVDKKNNDLVCMLDAGYGRDIDSGCYIWEFPERHDFGPKDATSAYGLLAEIDAD